MGKCVLEPVTYMEVIVWCSRWQVWEMMNWEIHRYWGSTVNLIFSKCWWYTLACVNIMLLQKSTLNIYLCRSSTIYVKPLAEVMSVDSVTTYISWYKVSQDRFSHKCNIKMGRAVPGNLLWPREKIHIQKIYKNLKWDKQMEISEGRNSLLTVGGSLGSLSIMSSSTHGDPLLPEEDLKNWRTELWQDQDLFFSFRISL